MSENKCEYEKYGDYWKKCYLDQDESCFLYRQRGLATEEEISRLCESFADYYCQLHPLLERLYQWQEEHPTEWDENSESQRFYLDFLQNNEKDNL